MLTLVLVWDQFIKLSALGEKIDSLTVHLPSVVGMSTGIGATAILSMLFTLMMLESDVKVHLHDGHLYAHIIHIDNYIVPYSGLH